MKINLSPEEHNCARVLHFKNVFRGFTWNKLINWNVLFWVATARLEQLHVVIDNLGCIVAQEKLIIDDIFILKVQ